MAKENAAELLGRQLSELRVQVAQYEATLAGTGTVGLAGNDLLEPGPTTPVAEPAAPQSFPSSSSL